MSAPINVALGLAHPPILHRLGRDHIAIVINAEPTHAPCGTTGRAHGVPNFLRRAARIATPGRVGLRGCGTAQGQAHRLPIAVLAFFNFGKQSPYAPLIHP